MKKIKSSMISVLALAVFATACIDVKIGSTPTNSRNKSNYVNNKTGAVNQHIGDEKVKLHVLSQNELGLMKLGGKIQDIKSINA